MICILFIPRKTRKNASEGGMPKTKNTQTISPYSLQNTIQREEIRKISKKEKIIMRKKISMRIGSSTKIFLGLIILSLFVASPVLALDDKTINANYISPDIAINQAKVSLNDYLSTGLSTIGKEWQTAKINTSPLIIYDIHGNKLFYEYSVENNGNQIGAVKVLANKVFGVYGSIIEMQPRYYDPIVSEKGAISKILSQNPGVQVTSTSLVSYNYPVIGIK